VDGAGLSSCPMAGFVTNDVEPFVYSITESAS
jgi:hypothetical protein